MPGKELFEALTFPSGSSFIVSRRLNPAYLSRPHWHPFAEILVSLSGGEEVSINFVNYRLSRGDILLIFPGDLHTLEKVCDESLLIIQFPETLFKSIPELDSCRSVLTRHPRLVYDPGKADSDRMVLLMKEFGDLATADMPFREVRMYAILLNFLALASECCLKLPSEQSALQVDPRSRSLHRMAEACLFISRSCTSPLTLDDAADHMNMSRSHFAHLFRAYTGSTFVEFLTSERIKYAQTRFRDPDRQIIDIAFDSGFTSISSFNRAFRRITGLSPSAYRENMVRHPEHPES